MDFRYCTFQDKMYPITYELYGNVKNRDKNESIFSRRTILEIGLAAILFMDEKGPKEVSYIDEGFDTEYQVWVVRDKTLITEFTQFITENGVYLHGCTIDLIKVLINQFNDLSIRVTVVDHEKDDDIFDLVWVRHDPVNPGQLQ